MLVGVNSTARSLERWSQPTNRITPLDSSLPMANRANPFRICTCRAPSVTPLESAVTKKGRGGNQLWFQRNSLTRYSSGCRTCDPFVTNSGGRRPSRSAPHPRRSHLVPHRFSFATRHVFVTQETFQLNSTSYCSEIPYPYGLWVYTRLSGRDFAPWN